MVETMDKKTIDEMVHTLQTDVWKELSPRYRRRIADVIVSLVGRCEWLESEYVRLHNRAKCLELRSYSDLLEENNRLKQEVERLRAYSRSGEDDSDCYCE